MPLTSRQKLAIYERLSGLCREVGTLLVAFAPLDYSMQHENVHGASLALFLAAGGVLFAFSVFLELRSEK